MYVSSQNMLDFVEHSQSNALRLSSDVGACPLFYDTQRFIQLAFDHGAYCAGGFATIVARATLNVFTNSGPEFYAAVTGHLNKSRRVTPNNTSQYATTGKGDIDLFFPSPQSIKEFYASDEVFHLLGTSAWSRLSALGLAREHFFCDGTEKVQVITKYTGQIKDLLSCFDIYNASVAFNKYHMIVPVGWFDLEKDRMLHVNRWNNFTVGRVNKYMRNKGYDKLSSKTASEICDKALAAFSESATMKENGQTSVQTRDLPTTSGIRAFGVSEPRKIAYRLQPYLTSFTNEQLLQISTLCPQGNYNEAFKLLINRGDHSQPHA